MKFFEDRDAACGDYQGPVQSTPDPLGVCRYEIKRIVAHRVFHRCPEYWVQWEGYDSVWDMWVHRDVLVDDVPHMVVEYHKLGGLSMQSRCGTPKRASVGRLLLSGEVAFPDVVSCVVLSEWSRVLSCRSGPSVDQVQERSARVGRRGGL